MKKTDVCLVYMPFADTKMPSMALSLLKACLAEKNISAMVNYANLYFAKQCGIREYNRLFFTKQNHLMGEFVFSKVAHGKSGKNLDDYVDWLFNCRSKENGHKGQSSSEWERRKKWLDWFQREAEVFIESTTRRILALEPKIVGISSMFQQNNASIALIKNIKKINPEIVVMIGGANCMGQAGAAMLEYVDGVDYVFFGEADEIFGDVCGDVLNEKMDSQVKLPYGVLSKDGCRQNRSMHRVTQNLDALPYPDFEDYFLAYQMLSKSKPILLVEGSRGCWWGEKSPCAFCGLNGLAYTYRSKQTKRLVAELEFLLEKYDANVCFFTDSILSNVHMKELPDYLKRLPKQAQYFCEIKSNVALADIRALVQAGFHYFQPGIESVQDDILRLMNKGCRAIKQIEALKIFKRCRAHAAWNILCGFPGETMEAYREIEKIIPQITHFQAPNSFFHLSYHRNSGYMLQADQYGLNLQPAQVYDFIYFACKDFIDKTAYLFEPVDEKEKAFYYNCTAKGGVFASIYQMVMDWNIGYRTNPDRLDMTVDEEKIEITDMRKIAKQTFYTLQGIDYDVYLACGGVVSGRALAEKFRARYTKDEISASLRRLCQDHLVIQIGEEYLALAVEFERGKANGRY